MSELGNEHRKKNSVRIINNFMERLDLTQVSPSSTTAPETDMSRPVNKPRPGEHSSKEIIEKQFIKSYLEHLYELATWLPPVHVSHEQSPVYKL
jgi:hypothetical protein